VSIEEQYKPSVYVLYQQNWCGHRFGDPQPPVLQMRFNTRSEAMDQKDRLRARFPDADTVVLCIAPAPSPGKFKSKGQGKPKGRR
jgi:hypothetical protein